MQLVIYFYLLVEKKLFHISLISMFLFENVNNNCILKILSSLSCSSSVSPGILACIFWGITFARGIHTA